MVDGWFPWGYASLVAVGLGAGFLNVVAGGGSLLTMPLLIFLGLSPGQANGTARLAILFQNSVAVVRYQRGGHLNLPLLRRLALPVMMGCVAGVATALWLGDLGFKRLLAWVMLGCAALVFLRPEPSVRATDSELRFLRLRAWVVGTVVGFYGGLVQAGVGYLILFLVPRLLRQSLVSANVLKVALVLLYTPIALMLFIWQDRFVPAPAVCLAVGQAVGGWLGARAAIARGVAFIRVVLVLVIMATAVQLLRG